MILCATPTIDNTTLSCHIPRVIRAEEAQIKCQCMPGRAVKSEPGAKQELPDPNMATQGTARKIAILAEQNALLRGIT